ncbi:MAG: isoprenylcysteine carboxylmethyltransferase family protein [Candidatus Hydrogenedentes bacterium]|nr:isoprenylcysteine carboxylmethyltransferase family protein [Candidatus Hydrogenedentota bacterium]
MFDNLKRVGTRSVKTAVRELGDDWLRRIMFDSLIRRIVEKSRQERSAKEKLLGLVADEAFFLILVPWLLILPAALLTRWIPGIIPRNAEAGLGVLTTFAGLSYSLWAVGCQWRLGHGTPSLQAPTEQLVVSGPYRNSRNPIQFGALLYVLGLGTLSFSLATGIVAAIVGLIVGIAYIKGIEEKELAVRFGAAYETYRKQTPFLVPWRCRVEACRGTPSGARKERMNKTSTSGV